MYYGARHLLINKSLHLANPILISIGANVPIVSAEIARPFMPLLRNAIAQMNRTA